VNQIKQDTIAAIATPPGNGGVGIIRISGQSATEIFKTLTHKSLHPRQALFTSFRDKVIRELGYLIFKEVLGYHGTFLSALSFFVIFLIQLLTL
jgi:tRNA U34 5-carboxymethylaminomethyl modifying GTPase MnmE/TrmE